jgi:hypothetical protein
MFFMHILQLSKTVSMTVLWMFGSFLLTSFSASGASDHPDTFADETRVLYQSIDFAGNEKPDFELFMKAMSGYYQLREADKLSGKDILTLIDFSKSGNEKRMWVIALNTKKVLYHSLVAHGRNSGDVYASKFSNTSNSNKSSLGFYVTGSTYIGKHGVSLKLHGQEKGINDQAEARAIVIHGADYVSESFIKKVGRLGRSLGCPAIPMALHKELIQKIAGGTCLFIYYPDESYLSSSPLLRAEANL